MYVADTHAWIYYLLNKLPQETEKIFLKVEEFKEVMFIPTICLNECIYLIERNKIKLDMDNLFSRLEESSNFLPAPLNLEITKLVPKIKLAEIHDRVVVATTKLLDAILITKDKEIVKSKIVKSKIVKTIW